MVTLLFIFIAYLMRKKYLADSANNWEKLIYYSVCVVVTPLFGPRLYKWLMEPNPEDNNKGDGQNYGYTYPGFL